jgi:hypothetical protein
MRSLLLAISLLFTCFDAKATAPAMPFEMWASKNHMMYQLNIETKAGNQALVPYTAITVENPADSGVDLNIQFMGVYASRETKMDIYAGPSIIPMPTNMTTGIVYSCNDSTTTTSKAIVTYNENGSSSIVTYGAKVYTGIFDKTIDCISKQPLHQDTLFLIFTCLSTKPQYL